MATLDLVEASISGVNLDLGDAGLIFIPGVGFRPADEIEWAAGQVVNACVIKCHATSYDDLPNEIVNYVPACGGEDGPGKWVGKWTPPFLSEPATPVYASILSSGTPYTPPWEPPTTTCCTTPWTPPETPPEVPVAPSLLFMATALAALAIKRIRT